MFALINTWYCGQQDCATDYNVQAIEKTVDAVDFHGAYELLVQLLTIHGRKYIIAKKKKIGLTLLGINVICEIPIKKLGITTLT